MSNDFMILIISFISSLEINKVIPFLYLGTLFPLISISNLFNGFEIKLLNNSDKLSVANRIATFGSAIFSKLAYQEPEDPPDWTDFEHLSFARFYISWDIISKGISYFSCLPCR